MHNPNLSSAAEGFINEAKSGVTQLVTDLGTGLENAAKSALGTLPELPLFEGIMAKLFIAPMRKTTPAKEFVESSKPPEHFKTLEDFHEAFVEEMTTCMETVNRHYPIRRDNWDLIEMATNALMQARKNPILRAAVLQTIENVFDYTTYVEYMNTVRPKTTVDGDTEPKRESEIMSALYKSLEIDESFTPKIISTDKGEKEITTMTIEVKIPVAEIPSQVTTDQRGKLYIRTLEALAKNRPDLRLHATTNLPYSIGIDKPTEEQPYYTLCISRDIMAPPKDMERTRKCRKHVARMTYVAAAITQETIKFVAAVTAAQEYGNERYEAFMKKVTRAIQVTRTPEILDEPAVPPAIPIITTTTRDDVTTATAPSRVPATTPATRTTSLQAQM